jgi:hypothetical protein
VEVEVAAVVGAAVALEAVAAVLHLHPEVAE